MRPSIARANVQLDPRQQLANTPPPINHSRPSPCKHSPDGATRANRLQLTTQRCARTWVGRKLKEVLHLYSARGYYPKSAQQGRRSYDRPVIFCIIFTIEWTRHRSSHTATLLVLFSWYCVWNAPCDDATPPVHASTIMRSIYEDLAG